MLKEYSVLIDDLSCFGDWFTNIKAAKKKLEEAEKKLENGE